MLSRSKRFGLEFYSSESIKGACLMVDNIIKSVAEKLSSLSYIEGIVLGGSRKGTHTEDSI